MSNKINNKMSKDYIGYSFWKSLRKCKIQIDINNHVLNDSISTSLSSFKHKIHKNTKKKVKK